MRCQTPLFLDLGLDFEDFEEPVGVPCGKCLICLQNKRNDWTFRLEQEWKASTSASFLTLTYSQKFCPTHLIKRHVQLFLKRLRKQSGNDRIRYYAVGEYGSRTGRPHYHILVFNCSDLSRFSRAWMLGKDPIGIVHVGSVSFASIAYCTKYVIQRDDYQFDEFEKHKRPFALMSRAYGIGGHYLTDEMCAWHREDNRNYCIRYGKKVRLPRFYRDKIFYSEEQKEAVRKVSMEEGRKADAENVRLIREAGYDDPVKIQRELREALLSRVKEKIAYTQTF